MNRKVLYKLGDLRADHRQNTVESSFEAAVNAGMYGFMTARAPFFAQPEKRSDRGRVAGNPSAGAGPRSACMQATRRLVLRPASQEIRRKATSAAFGLPEKAEFRGAEQPALRERLQFGKP